MRYKFRSNEIIIGNKTKTFEDDNFIIYWEGTPFIKGYGIGEESFSNFVDKLKNDSIENVCNLLSGIFACIIQDKKKTITYSFSDNVGIYNFLYSPDYISTSFLELVKISQLKKSDLNPLYLTNFFLTSSCMGWTTFFDGIKKIRFNEILIDDGKNIKFKCKNLFDIFSLKNCEGTFIEKFKTIADSFIKLKGKISIDLSGGLDTRLIAVLFKYYGVEYETAVSGMPDSPDVIISKEVAKLLEVPHNVVYHQVDANNISKELDDAFLKYDSLANIISWHRYYQLQKIKYKNNCELTITGHAGEFYKPAFIWTLDNKDPKKAINQMLNLNTGVRYGLKFNAHPINVLTEKYINHCISYKNRLREFLLKNFGNDTSGKTGPKIYYYFMEGSRTINMGCLVDRYSPLLDRDIVPFGLTLKNRSQTLRGDIRRMLFKTWDDRIIYEKNLLSSLDKKVAKLKLAGHTYFKGISGSTNRFELLKNIIFNSYRGLKKRISSTKNKIRVSSTNPEFYPIIKSLNKTGDLIEILKNEKILKTNISVEEIDDVYIGAFYTIGKLIEYIQDIN